MGLLKKRGKGRGLKENLSFFFLSSPEAEEGGDAGAAAPGRRPWGTAAAMEEGKRGREPREIDSLPRLGRRRPEAAAPLQCAAAGAEARGGSAASWVGWRVGAAVVVEVEGTVEALFLGRGESRRRGERWPAGELRGRAVMAVGAVRWRGGDGVQVTRRVGGGV